MAENATAVTTVTASDVDAGATLSYSISGGADASRFTIDAATGALAFATAPNFEMPTDADANNVYDVQVQVSDSMLTDVQNLTVTFTGVNEAPTIANIMFSRQAITFVAADPDGSEQSLSYTQGFTTTVSNGVPTSLSARQQNSVLNARLQVEDDALSSEAGPRIVFGTRMADTVDAEAGVRAAIWGFGGNDSLTGSSADDYLVGGGGNDTLTGDIGSDRFVFESSANNNGVDSLFGFVAGTGNDMLDFSALLGENNRDYLLSLTANTKNQSLDVDTISGDDNDNDVLLVTLNAQIAGKDYGRGDQNFNDLFGTNKVFSTSFSGNAVVIVRGTDQTHVYFVESSSSGAFDSRDVGLVGIIQNVSGDFANDNFA